MNKTVNFTMFILGAAIGSVVTWKYIKHKYEQIAQDEIDSVKEVFLKRETDISLDENSRSKAEHAKDKPSVVEYAARLREQGYTTNYSNGEKNEKEESKPMRVLITRPLADNKPYVISPEEFGDQEDYDKISLTYYADKRLADDNDELVEDVDNVVGLDSLNSFGEYEDDSVFVRNDILKCDYEILLDQRKYSSVIRRKPHEVDD